MKTHSIQFRTYRPEDSHRLEEIRKAAFQPIFASFRAIMGDQLYALAQARDDQQHDAFLRSLLDAESPWEVYVAEKKGHLVGFVCLCLNHETLMGEVGLNAVDPQQAGEGIGTLMYQFAVERLTQAGMKAAFVGTGGDSSHAPARRAYAKAGFETSLPTVWMYRQL